MTAHVARKGEPDDKSNIAKSNQCTNPNQNYTKQDVKKFGNIFTTIDSSQIMRIELLNFYETSCEKYTSQPIEMNHV